MTKEEFGKMRRIFDHPISARMTQGKPGEYCVGGAFLQFISGDDQYDFPPPSDLVSHMQKHCPDLSLSPVEVFASAFAVTRLNDNGRFEEAWEKLASIVMK